MVSRDRRSDGMSSYAVPPAKIGMSVFPGRSLMERWELRFLLSTSTTRERLYMASAQRLPTFSFVHNATCD